MNTLSLFPSTFAWVELVPFLLRLTIGAVFLHWAYRDLRHGRGGRRLHGLAEGIAGILFVIGMWTQAAALYALVDLCVRLAGRVRRRAFLTDGVNYYLLLAVVAASLFILGAGAFAFDLRV